MGPVCKEDETLNRRLETEFAEDDVSWGSKGAGIDWGFFKTSRRTYTWGLEGKAPYAPENLSFHDPPDGSVVPAVATEEVIRKEIISSHSGASGGPEDLRTGDLRSLVAHG